MRKWIALIIVGPLIWAGYWFLGAYGLKSEINQWLTERSDANWQVEYSELNVRGFPNRFDTTLSGPQLTDPNSGISWTAPFFQLLSLSYKPNHVIAVWPDRQIFSTPHQRIEIATKEMRASAVFAPNSKLTLVRGTLVGTDFVLASNADWDIEIENISASSRQLDRAEVYEFSILIDALHPSQKLRQWLGEHHNLPAEIENLTAQFVTELSKPLDITSLETARPRVKSLKISRLEAKWGEIVLRAEGNILVNKVGEMSGELQLNAKNWRKMLQLLVSSGTFSEEIANAVELGLGFFARLDGSENTLNTTVSLRNGNMYLGPIPIGTAPKLIIR